MSKKYLIKGTNVNSYETARRKRTGPYEDHRETLGPREFTERYLDIDTGVKTELDAAEAELTHFCAGRGQPVDVSFDGIGCTYTGVTHDMPERERINEAIHLLCAIAWIRHALDTGNVTAERLADIFRLGLNLERWRMMPFNKSAAGGIRQSVNASEQQAKARKGKIVGTALRNLYAEMREKYPKEQVQQIHTRLAGALSEVEGGTVTEAAIKKRLQRHKKLGTQV